MATYTYYRVHCIHYVLCASMNLYVSVHPCDVAPSSVHEDGYIDTDLVMSIAHCKALDGGVKIAAGIDTCQQDWPFYMDSVSRVDWTQETGERERLQWNCGR